MGIIVQKFGGSSVADNERLLNVCKHIINEYNKNNKVVVVVSAQGKTTDKLVSEESQISKNPDKREHDVLVSTGEQITIAKLAIYLKELGYDAISYTGWQIPIVTDDIYGNANIIDIKTDKILQQLENNKIVVVAGFQGVNKEGDITTLGRGGSDTTAVALACYLNADKLYIYTDVDGVYSEDPNVNPNAIKYETISYDKMIQMAKSGAKVLHTKCVEMAKENNVPIIVKSTFVENEGTTVQ
ncbi:MAG: aspartate kinase [Clostridia bacterium]|nr:aspartate kinase [Clostridia bacterium]